MPDMAVTFRGLHTELSPHALPSGAAATAVNVALDGAGLRGRQGLDVYDAGTGFSNYAVVNMTVARFASGEVYLVLKVDDASIGEVWFKKIYPTAGSWTPIADKYEGHSRTDPGWFFQWADRLYYFDSVGGTKWHPSVGTFKAGITSSTGALLAEAAGGEKEGYYHVYVSKWNDVTKEESSCAGPQDPGLETRLSADKGGIALTSDSWTAIKAADADYEWTHIRLYCTMGNTEWLPLGEGAQCYSHKAYYEQENAKGGALPGLNKADHVLNKSLAFTNAGGEPPAAAVGAFNGGRAVYLNIYESEALVPGKVRYSIPRFPCMVPQRRSYTQGGDATWFYPKPWMGEIAAAFAGTVTGCGHAGRRFVVFTDSATYWLTPLADGRLYPTLAHPAHGCASVGGAVTTPLGVYAIGNECLIHADAQRGVRNLARYDFTDVLEAIPAAYRSLTTGAYLSARNQVWFAVAKPGGTQAQRILIYDESRGELATMFEPACLGYRAVLTTALAGVNNDLTYTAPARGTAGSSITVCYEDTGTAGSETVAVTGTDIVVAMEAGVSTAAQIATAVTNDADASGLVTVANAAGNDGTGTVPVMAAANLSGGTDTWSITAMTELSSPGDSPQMLIATDNGEVFTWPGTLYSDDGGGYAASWIGYVGQEKRHHHMTLESMEVHMGTNANGISVGAAGLLTGGESGDLATLTTALAGTHNDMKYTAVSWGTAGNSIGICYEDTGTAGSETVSVVGSEITVGMEAGVSTAAQIATAITNDDDASGLVTVINATGNDGTGTVPAMAVAYLAGGTAAQTPVTNTITRDQTVATVGPGFDNKLNGRLFKLSISSTAANLAQWEVKDLILRLRYMD